jgi:hypothetical protein
MKVKEGIDLRIGPNLEVARGELVLTISQNMKAKFKQIKLNLKEKKLQTKREENLTKETLKKIKETLNQRKIKYEEGA